ncbi:hypothetical protein BC830DRAFT_227944 [Chytriomyces sp. MP71]|nr:hypothetical protein BC830DRAFT_227944 [Chytriomyces sp. MP71]
MCIDASVPSLDFLERRDGGFAGMLTDVCGVFLILPRQIIVALTGQSQIVGSTTPFHMSLTI